MEYTEQRDRTTTEETLNQVEAGLYRALSEAEDSEARNWRRCSESSYCGVSSDRQRSKRSDRSPSVLHSSRYGPVELSDI
jgi:hypothetical protein